MNTEQKAQAYEEALERAKKVHKYSSDLAEIKRMEDIFPELRESEDEKIRKELIEFVKSRGGFKQEYIAWLEKQGENHIEENLEMVKPAWSEEDERNLQGIIDEIEANKNQSPDYDLATYDRFLSWLKSLKDRYTWKPSEEQISALDFAIDCTVYPEFQDKSKVLIELLEQLKKL